MRSKVTAAVLTMILVLGSGMASAHFGMVIPSDNMVAQGEEQTITLTLSFSHPFEGIGMELVKPDAFKVMAMGKENDLTQTLAPAIVMGHPAWTTRFTPRRPGLLVFAMIPKPYWEPAEDCYILHLTKTYVAAFGDDEGWDEPLGLETEIIPLSKPHGLWAGNLFQGRVMLKGKPVPWAEVEVEYYNEKGGVKAPSDLMVTQTIKADGNGVFSYMAPFDGWWGFAALNTADRKMAFKGEDKNIELGAVIWVHFEKTEGN